MFSWLPPTYDFPATVTKSDTVDDPAGPFAAVLCTAAGSAIVFPVSGPQRTSGITIVVVAGQILPFPIKRVGASSSNVVGLVCDPIAKTGPTR
jgi:hypothetical protein